MKKILMACYGGGHINLLLPVYQALRTEFDITFLALSIAGNVLKCKGLPYKNYSSYANEIIDEKALQYGKQLANLWHVEGKVPRSESEAYFGACMRDLVDYHGEKEAFRRIENLGRKAFVPVYTAKKILRIENPDLIVTTNSPRTERALTLAGNAMGIPTLNIHDHLAFEERHHLSADRIAVMCEITRQNLIDTGHDPQKIYITGQPAFDAIIREMKTMNREDLISKHSLNPDARYILFGSQKQVTDEILTAVIEAVERLYPHYRLLVKPHPGENYYRYEQLNRKYPNFFLFLDTNIRELIFLSEVMITLWSTVALEAVLMEKPLIQLNLPNLQNMIPLFKYKVAIEADSLDMLSDSIQKAIADTEYRNEFNIRRKQYFDCLLSGNGSKNIRQLIRDQVGV